MESKEHNLDFLKRYAQLLDSEFRIPGTRFRFGLDPLMSLIPGLGSFSGLITGGILVLMSKLHHVSTRTQSLMIHNLVLDFLIGLIPIIGTIKDFTFKANKKNMRLIEENLNEGKHNESSRGIWIRTIIILLFALLLGIILVILGIAFLVKILLY